MPSTLPPDLSDSGLDRQSARHAQTTERQRQALHIVRDALATDPGARDDMVMARCGPDTSLHDQVQALLRAVATVDLETQVPDSDAASHDGAPSTTFGPFQPIRFLGRGGMAEVWLARRNDCDFEQQVALKLMHPGLLRQERRFRDERQILARLNHPNIAHLIDGGVSADGRPWLALEHVDGERITDWCDAHQLDLRARIRLMLPVCEAVGHAHRNLIVHRDIKPGNILVTRDGVPKLLDFGIAKLLDASDPELTQTLALTPAYASPEQRRGEIVTTASDVHQLGLVLYRLLCGIDANPFASGLGREGTGSTSQRMELAFLALQRSDAASADQVAQSRQNSQDRLRAQLRGDLGRIVGKAIHEDPRDRYGSPGELASDLCRWLDNKPILASRHGVLYLTTRFLRRNRTATALAAVLLLGLVAVAAALVWQQRQTSHAADRALALTDYLVDMFHQVDTGAGPAQLSARDILARGAERLDTLPKNDPARFELLGTLLKLYDDMSLQRDGYEVAVRELGQQPPASLFRDTASLYALTGRLRLSDSVGQAQMRAELPLLVAVVENYPDRSDPMYAYATGQIGERYADLGESEHSEHWHRRALELLASTRPANDPILAKTRVLLAGAITSQRRGREGLALTEQAIADISDEDSRERAYVFTMAGVRRALFGDFAGAETLFRETRRIVTLLGDTRLADYYATTHITNAIDLGEFEHARSMIDAAIQGAQGRVSARGQDHVAALKVLSGELALAQDRFGDAASDFGSAVALYLLDQTGDSHSRITYPTALQAIALTLDNAPDQARAVLQLLDTPGSGATNPPVSRTVLVDAAFAVLAGHERRFPQSRAAFQRALQRLAEAQQQPAPVQQQLQEYRDAVRVRLWQAQMLLAEQATDEAVAVATEARTLASTHLGAGHPLTLAGTALMTSLTSTAEDR